MIDWNLVRKVTLWDYEELTKKISEVFSYGFIQKYYDHMMNDAIDYAKKIFEYDQKYAKRISSLTDTFKSLSSSGIKTYRDLIHEVENKEKCEDFLKQTQLPFEDLISTLNHIFRWVLPHSIYLRELTDSDNESHRRHVGELRTRGIRLNLDMLEHGRTRDSRERLSEETRIPKPLIIDLVNLADMSRLPFSNRKTVKHLYAGGYGSLAILAQRDSVKMIEDMKSYFDRIGVRISGFIDLRGIAQWAKTLPIVVEI